ncbi:MAG: PmoA family protein [Verrucomicrobia bacterium]|nr:PmoA family protein [Verrucomicrobiota bacterium]MDA1067690.1 PmoA family protein [Verrucomicrobiota bacterium]
MLPRIFFLFFLLTSAQLFAGVLRLEKSDNKISVFRENGTEPILVENVRADHRPYIHPIVAPDGNGELTQYSPGHHLHQTGLYWGFTRVNGRDYFHNPSNGYWKLLEANVISAEGEVVQWETIYHLLDEEGTALMEETQVWSMRDLDDEYFIDLVWSGKAHTDLTISEFKYGGLFLRMPWEVGNEGEVVNSSRQKNQRAEGQRSSWVDVGMEIKGRDKDDWGHIAIFDHPDNDAFPMPWRVDNQLGVGPARSLLGDWKIPAGATKTYRHQFKVYTGQLNDIHMHEDWKAYTGQTNNYAEWITARNEAKEAEFLTGEQAIEKMTVPDGLEVTLVTSEPQITQPLAFCWDDRGRMWIAENRDYETRRSGFSNYGDSRILILEDVDGDGKMDTKKVFLEGIPFPSAIAVGFDGLWLGAPPNLMFVPDRDADDKADEEIEVRLTGWGIRDRHEVLNSFIWGPDGWLYGCQGFATPSTVGKPVDGGRVFKKGDPFPTSEEVVDGQFIDGGIFRYHPIKDRFEVVSHGFSNPWGLDFDDHGQAFISACVIPHAFHIIQGGIFHRQGGKHINPYVYSDIQTIVDHRHRSAHGGARVYLADLLPEKYHNKLFMANIHEHALLNDELVRNGSGFIAKHGEDTVLANDPQWIGFSLEIGPEGAIYMLDWHDGDICGNDVQDKDTGRVYRLAPEGTPFPTNFNLKDLSDSELVEMQLHRNDWYVRHARVILHERAEEGILSPGVHDKLWAMFKSQSDSGRKLRALWALHVTGGASQDQLVKVLNDSAEYVRAWAIQLLCEDMDPGKAALKKFISMAKSDPSPVVRLYLASALQRIPKASTWDIAEGLLSRAEDQDDHNIPKMIWFGVEPNVPENPVKALQLASSSNIPLVAQFIARRATSGQLLDVVVGEISKASSNASRKVLLEGMRDGLLGQRDLSAPVGWSKMESNLIGVDSLRNLVLQIGQLFGSAEAGKAQLAQLNDSSTDLERRKEILQNFGLDVFPPAFDSILGYLSNSDLRLSALRALSSYEDNSIEENILEYYSEFTPEEKAVAVQTLATRRGSARTLVAALKRNSIPRSDISAVNARQLRRVVGPDFVDWWGPMETLSKDKQQAMDRYKFLLTDEYMAHADVMNGKTIFDQTCAACHKMYGEGGIIGPDITGSNRADLAYILSNIIDPSSEIPEGYQLVTISTQDGRTFAGNVTAEDDQRLTLAMVGQEVVLAKSEILSRQTSPVSMMPEGQLNAMSDSQVRDLIGYLRTTHPIN